MEALPVKARGRFSQRRLYCKELRRAKSLVSLTAECCGRKGTAPGLAPLQLVQDAAAATMTGQTECGWV
jgi:hypothetical protein